MKHLKLTGFFLLLVVLMIFSGCAAKYNEDIYAKYKFKAQGGDFTLTSQYEKAVSLKDFRGKTVILFFGYTVCPDVCPTTLAELKKTLALLGPKSEKVQVIFITVDPQRDSAAMLKDYLAQFNPTILGLRGTEQEIASVAKLYGAKYKKRDAGSAAGYLIDHTAYSYVINGEGKLVDLIRFNTDPDEIVEQLEGLI